MMILKYAMALWLVFSAIGCNQTAAPTPGTGIDTFPVADSLSIYSREWVNDSAGCLHVRDGRMAQRILSLIKVKPISSDEIRIWFGKPDFINVKDKDSVWIYAFDAVCKNKRLLMDAENCWVKIYMNNSVYIKMESLCQ